MQEKQQNVYREKGGLILGYECKVGENDGAMFMHLFLEKTASKFLCFWVLF